MDCAKFFQFDSFQRGNIIEVGQTVFCWLKPAALALWLSEAQFHRSHVLSLAALWHHSLLMNGIVMYMYYLLEKKIEIWVRRQNGRTNSYYRNDPKFSDRQVWANSADPDQTADQRLDGLPFRLQPCPNFRVITANVWTSELLGVLWYTTSITLSLVSELISVSYPNNVRLRVKCIEGVLTSHLGSNLDLYHNQNRVITNNVIKRFSCTRIT